MGEGVVEPGQRADLSARERGHLGLLLAVDDPVVFAGEDQGRRRTPTPRRGEVGGRELLVERP
ncbi:MAG: hypothetical protein IPJ34_28075 [Myxococcales bacterium]|nr:hypothetical protein [Myxococcales bacterium]